MATCKCGVTVHYGTVCYKCRTQKQDAEIKEINSLTPCVIWYNNIIKSEKNKYTTSEIYNAFDMVWDKLKIINPDKKRFDRKKFKDLLQEAWDYGLLPDYFMECADKLKNEHIPGKGLEILEGLGLINNVPF